MKYLASINWGAFFAYLVAALQFCSAIGYFARGQTKMGVLWGCWAIGNVMVILIGMESH